MRKWKKKQWNAINILWYRINNYTQQNISSPLKSITLASSTKVTTMSTSRLLFGTIHLNVFMNYHYLHFEVLTIYSNDLPYHLTIIYDMLITIHIPYVLKSSSFSKPTMRSDRSQIPSHLSPLPHLTTTALFLSLDPPHRLCASSFPLSCRRNS